MDLTPSLRCILLSASGVRSRTSLPVLLFRTWRTWSTCGGAFLALWLLWSVSWPSLRGSRYASLAHPSFRRTTRTSLPSCWRRGSTSCLSALTRACLRIAFVLQVMYGFGNHALNLAKCGLPTTGTWKCYSLAKIYLA